MKCPFCGNDDDRVLDSRPAREGAAVRRRRECSKCSNRFTTYEYVERTPLMVVKRNGSREPFDRGKLLAGVVLACRKRPISVETIDAFLDSLEQTFQDSGRKEIASVEIGERIMNQLHEWDDVAYVRFASVYRQFQDTSDFMLELKELLERKKRVKKGGRLKKTETR